MMKRQQIQIQPWFAAAVGSGALLIFAFSPFDLFPIAWFALVPLLYSLYGLNKQDAFRAGFLFGLSYFFGTIYWIYYSVHHYGGIPFVPSLLLIVLLCCYLALYPAVFSVMFSSLLRRSHLPAMLIAPLFWTVGEFGRSYLLTGFPWSSLGYSQTRFLPMIQIADIVGIYGISFLVMAVNGAVVDMLILRKRHSDRPLFAYLPTLAGAVLLGVSLIFSLVYGYWRLNQDRTAETVRVAVIQGNIAQDKKWDPAFRHSVITIYQELTSSAVQTAPQMIVWPESAIPFVFERDIDYTEQLQAFQKRLDAYLLFGTILQRDPKQPVFTNGAALLSKDGSLSYLYDKIHLVPFGEYVPLRQVLFFVDKLAYGIGDYVSGDSYIQAVTPFGSFPTLICYEIIFPGLARKFFVRGGDFLVTITNDAWFGTTNGPYQHFSMAVFRAIENRKPVVRAANSGISGFIDSNGRIGKTTELMTRTILVNDIKTDRTITFYTKYGDLFSFLCIALSVILFFKKYNV